MEKKDKEKGVADVTRVSVTSGREAFVRLRVPKNRTPGRTAAERASDGRKHDVAPVWRPCVSIPATAPIIRRTLSPKKLKDHRATPSHVDLEHRDALASTAPSLGSPACEAPGEHIPDVEPRQATIIRSRRSGQETGSQRLAVLEGVERGEPVASHSNFDAPRPSTTGRGALPPFLAHSLYRSQTSFGSPSATTSPSSSQIARWHVFSTSVSE